MRIAILTFGTRGDVRPLVTLGRGLADAGYGVRVLTHPVYEPLVRDARLDFRAVGSSTPALAYSWAKPRRFKTVLMRNLRGAPPLLQIVTPSFLDACRDACRDADALVFSFLGIGGPHIAERLGIPAIGAYLYPGFQLDQDSHGAPRHLIGRLVLATARRRLNTWRAESLGLRRLRRSEADYLRHNRVPMVFGFSPEILPPGFVPAPARHVTGYWMPSPAPWEPPPDLARFLDAGDPPVGVTFGSTLVPEPLETARILSEAIRAAGRRVVFLAGESGVELPALPDVYSARFVPFDWLAPRLAAFVHHAGAGTSAECLRAGIPSVPMPFGVDQLYWAARLHAIGVASPPLPYTRVGARDLSEAIRFVCEDADVRERARIVGERVRAEDGVGRAVDVISEALGRARATTAVPV